MRAPERGFTLLELLIAMTVTMAVVALVFAGFGVIGRSLERTQQHMGRAEQMLQTRQWLGQKFDSLRMLQQQEGPQFVLFFSGNAAGAMWVAPLPEQGQTIGLYVLRATPLRHEDGRIDLSIEALPYQGVQTQLNWQQARREILLENLRTLQWAYQGDTTQPWQADWDAGRKTYPARVRLTLGDQQGDWPELIFALPRSQ